MKEQTQSAPRSATTSMDNFTDEELTRRINAAAAVAGIEGEGQALDKKAEPDALAIQKAERCVSLAYKLWAGASSVTVEDGADWLMYFSPEHLLLLEEKAIPRKQELTVSYYDFKEVPASRRPKKGTVLDDKLTIPREFIKYLTSDEIHLVNGHYFKNSTGYWHFYQGKSEWDVPNLGCGALSDMWNNYVNSWLTKVDGICLECIGAGFIYLDNDTEFPCYACKESLTKRRTKRGILSRALRKPSKWVPVAPWALDVYPKSEWYSYQGENMREIDRVVSDNGVWLHLKPARLWDQVPDRVFDPVAICMVPQEPLLPIATIAGAVSTAIGATAWALL